MQQISLLGCGWLGISLAKELKSKGYKINGSTTSSKKIEELQKNGIEPFLILLDNKNVFGKIDDFLQGSSILIIAIPPKWKKENPENLFKKISNLIPFIEKSTVKKVLFISSISVYENRNQSVYENSIPNPETENGKELLKTEELLKSNKNFTTTIIRFGGLIGEDRNPVKTLSLKENINNPNAPINLIHLDDCVGIILQIISLEYWGKIVNGVAPYHPFRKIYYTEKAKELNLSAPKFDFSKNSVGKTVNSSVLSTSLNYNFIRKEL